MSGEDIALSCGADGHVLDDWLPVGVGHYVANGEVPAALPTLAGEVNFVKRDGSWCFET